MNSFLTSNKKVRVIALGCGSAISQRLMMPGSSAWLCGISLPYDRDEINAFGGSNTKFVSRDRVQAIMDNLPVREGVVDIVISGKLATLNEREGRDNLFHYAVRDGSRFSVGVKEFNVTKNKDHVGREAQESAVADFVVDTMESIKREDTRTVFSGSFDPVHEGHKEHLDQVRLLSLHNPIIEMTRRHISKENGGNADDRMAVALLEFENVTPMITDSPKYLDKYRLLKQQMPAVDIVFLVGDDIWLEWGDSLKADFSDDDGNPFTDVQFFVAARDEVRAEVEKHALLHPSSWMHTPSQEVLSMSSSAIRNSVEAAT